MSFTKKLLAVSAFLLLTVISFAQSKVITWKGASEQSGNGEYVVKAIGTFTEAGWHIYALGPYDGPNATALTVNPPAGVTLVGKPYITSKVKEYFDETWGMDIGICEETVVVCQKVKVTSTVEIPFTIEWQACNEGSCIAPDEENLSVRIEVAAPAAAKDEVKAAPDAEAGEVSNDVAAEAEQVAEDVANEASDDAAAAVAAADEAPAQVAAADEEKSSSKSIWALILEAIGWGFVALLTPCVFPMIPMTVSFFLKQNSGEGENKKGRGRLLASAFGIFIVLLYTLPIAIIILSTYIFGGATVTADIFNWLATHWL
ncbi:MAG: thiol:disulfide interchange protein, partial [Bacteroidales bacterium]|nr:thiol:disulfide interchange protein [Bacteroidales bacterium]